MTRFFDVGTIEIAVRKKLRVNAQKSFQESMESWQKKMAKYVSSQGD